jgi:hypothetical protein
MRIKIDEVNLKLNLHVIILERKFNWARQKNGACGLENQDLS